MYLVVSALWFLIMCVKLLRYELLIIVLGTIFITKADPAQDVFLPVSPALMAKSSQACQAVARQPHFSTEAVTGKPWRMYYTWNFLLREACVDVHCTAATPEVIRRIRYDMNRSLSEHPKWNLATLLLTIGKNHQEILLFPDMRIPGRFLGVNYYISDFFTRKIPLLKLQMKLLRNGKYLLFMDCLVGIAWLGSRFDDEPPYRMDVESVVSELMPYLGEGYQACTNENNLIETAAQPESKKMRPNLMEMSPGD